MGLKQDVNAYIRLVSAAPGANAARLDELSVLCVAVANHEGWNEEKLLEVRVAVADQIVFESDLDTPTGPEVSPEAFSLVDRVVAAVAGHGDEKTSAVLAEVRTVVQPLGG